MLICGYLARPVGEQDKPFARLSPKQMLPVWCE